MKNLPVLAVLAAAIVAGSSGVFIKYIHIPATSLSFIRTTIPSIILALWMLWRGIPFFRGNYPIMLGASTLNALRMYFFFTAYIFTTISNAVIITFSWPIFVTIFSIIFLKEEVSKRNIFLLALAFLGIMVVYGDQPFSLTNKDFIGMSAALGAAVTHAIIVVTFKRESQNYTQGEIIFYQNFLSMFIFLPFIIYNRPLPTINDIVIASSHALLLGLLGFSLFFYGLKYLKASTVSLLAYLEIVSALCFGVFWMKESLSLNMIIGGILIIMSTFFLRKT